MISGQKTVSLSLSHWYPGSGMVLDCIDPCLIYYDTFDNLEKYYYTSVGKGQLLRTINLKPKVTLHF